MDIKIDTRTKAQKRAEQWADLYRQLAEANPTASPWRICGVIAEETSYTTQAVFYKLKANGVLTSRRRRASWTSC